jgi:hypothetical protein
MTKAKGIGQNAGCTPSVKLTKAITRHNLIKSPTENPVIWQ